MRRILLLVLLLPPVFADAQKKANPKTFAKSISAEEMKKHLYIVASAEMEGRETATEGQRKSAAYIENQFRLLGLLPGNKGSYQMYYPVYRDSLLNASVEVNGNSFQPGTD